MQSEIIKLLKSLIEIEFKKSVEFKISTIKKCNNWILVSAVYDSSTQFLGVKFEKMIKNYAHDNGILALMKVDTIGKYDLVEYEIGSTDTNIISWIQKHQLQNCQKEFDVNIQFE